MTFNLAVQHLLGAEGGYVNDPNDRGGETKFGISKRSYPHVDIKNLTRSGAEAIYKRDYWDANRIGEMPVELQYPYFDAAVNCGSANAARFLQEAINTVAAPPVIPVPLTVDGAFGPLSWRALRIATAQPGFAANVTNEFMWIRIRHHARDARDHATQQKFLPGWIIRCTNLRHENSATH